MWLGAESRDINAVLAENETARKNAELAARSAGKPPPRCPDGFLVLKLAEKYGQSPDDVENWSEHYFFCAVELMEGEGLHAAAEHKAMERERNRR